MIKNKFPYSNKLKNISKTEVLIEMYSRTLYKSNMFFKKYENESGVSFPEKWQNRINSSFEEVFAEKFKIEGSSFQNYGFIHADEVLIVSSLVFNNKSQSPITLFISKELKDKEKEAKKLEKIKNSMIDIAGIIFNEILRNFQNFSYQTHWQDYEFKKDEYFYKTTRENVDLTIQANELLEKL